MPSASRAEAASGQGMGGEGRLRTIKIGAAVGACLLGLLGFLLVGADAELEPATLGLVAAGGALLYVLLMLRRMALALGRPEAQTLLASERLVAMASRRELREEKKRVLRAIKELDFDHAMGKISDEDHRAVRERYQLRAVEVLRALDERPQLHPKLQADLEAVELGDRPSAPTAEAAAGGEDESQDEAPSSSEGIPEFHDPGPTKAGCVQCGGVNDFDAKFCKHCGAKLDS